ncbi:MAG: fluoride efflux transporter CrcB [Microscillaceae bacterium]|jgi:CrcB protein|nr:fluoride efflux transporter CrcB [Microscillaceae bacterium]
MNYLQNYFWVFVGGGLGSICRFGLGRWLNQNSALPWGTLAANVLGCFLIGVLIGYFQKNPAYSASGMFLWVTGFCGGFTTFSTFAYENMTLLKNGNHYNFLIYSGFSLFLCFLGTWLGLGIFGK